jgi:hypothetical protein
VILQYSNDEINANALTEHLTRNVNDEWASIIAEGVDFCVYDTNGLLHIISIDSLRFISVSSGLQFKKTQKTMRKGRKECSREPLVVMQCVVKHIFEVCED